MDQAQRAAEPLTPVSPASLIRSLKTPEEEASESPEAIENRQRAATEIAMIFELKDSRAFQWFVEQFLDSEYGKAFEALRSPYTKHHEIADVQKQYVVLRKVKVGMLEREIAHREQLDPGDEMLPVLRSKLAQL
jgi:hypothetical protein